jgi:hypothetical protein
LYYTALQIHEPKYLQYNKKPLCCSVLIITNHKKQFTSFMPRIWNWTVWQLLDDIMQLYVLQ